MDKVAVQHDMNVNVQCNAQCNLHSAGRVTYGTKCSAMRNAKCGGTKYNVEDC